MYNDWMKSWICGAKVAYDFCDYESWRDCTNDHGNWGAGGAKSSSIEYERRMTSLKLYPYDATIRGAVTLFHNNDCTGHLGRFYAPTESGYKEKYTKTDMAAHNSYADNMNSILIPFGTSVDLWSGPSFNSKKITLSGQPFEDSRGTVTCLNASDFPDDGLSWAN